MGDDYFLEHGHCTKTSMLLIIMKKTLEKNMQLIVETDIWTLYIYKCIFIHQCIVASYLYTIQSLVSSDVSGTNQTEA